MCLALEGAGCAHCDKFTMKKLHLRLALFSRVHSRDLSHGDHRSSWPRKRDIVLSHSSVTGSSDLLDQEVLSLASSGPMESMLLVKSPAAEPSPSVSPT